MSKWITDRRPTAEDANDNNLVCIKWGGQNHKSLWWNVREKEAWRKIPTPNVLKYDPKWEAVWDREVGKWCLICDAGQVWMEGLDDTPRHKEAIDRIVEILNEVMP